MYFGEAMWVVLNVVEPGGRQHIQDAVEQEVCVLVLVRNVAPHILCDPVAFPCKAYRDM